MGCCEARKILGSDYDLTDFEENLGLFTIKCNEFTNKMVELTNENYQIRDRDLGEYFKDYKFGQTILESDSQMSKLLAYKKFAYHHKLDCSYVFLLGLLYSTGNTKMKSECIYKFFDRKNEGQLPTSQIKQIFSFFFEVSVILVPALQASKSIDDYKDAYKATLGKFEAKAMKTFKKSENIKKEDFLDKMMASLKIVLHPGGIRKEIQQVTASGVLEKYPLDK